MKLERIFAIALAAIVASAIVLAFRVTGSPQHQRDLAIDRQRIERLSNIAELIEARYGSKRRVLPPRLPSDFELADANKAVIVTYRRIDARRYELCTTFALPAEKHDNPNVYDNAEWKHGAGRRCYRFDRAADTPES